MMLFSGSAEGEAQIDSQVELCSPGPQLMVGIQLCYKLMVAAMCLLLRMQSLLGQAVAMEMHQKTVRKTSCKAPL
jgi:hypothetical protein